MADPEHESLDATLQRLKRERDEAIARYNEALTALDRALMRLPEFPHPPPPSTSTSSRRSTTPWNIGASAARRATAALAKGRLAAFVWRIVGPPLQQQLTFNSLLVDHLNRNAAAHREAQRAIDSVIGDAARADLGSARCSSRAWSSTCSRSRSTWTRRTARRPGRRWSSTRRSTAWPRTWRSGGSRWSRASSATRRAWPASAPRTRSCARSSASSQQASMTMKRELERLIASARRHRLPNSSKPTCPDADLKAGLRIGQLPKRAFAPALDAYKYVGFEDQFRGSQEIDPRAARELPAVLRRRGGRARRRLRARRVPRSAEGARHQRARARSESRDGRGLPRARARRRRGGRRRLPRRRCPTRRSAASSPRRWSSTCSPATCCGSSSSRSTSCGRARRSCSRR